MTSRHFLLATATLGFTAFAAHADIGILHPGNSENAGVRGCDGGARNS